MADFQINIPNKNLVENSIGERNELATTINSMKSKYSNIVNEVAANSNIPAELIYSFMAALSNGKNNKPFMTGDRLIRSGLFSLSNKVGKGILATEKANGRMNAAETAFLQGAGDATLSHFLDDDKLPTDTLNKHWKSAAGTGVDRISDNTNPVDWTNPKIAIQTGAIWIGQVWDKFSEQTKSPLDKVIVTILLPYGLYWQAGQRTTIFGSGWLMGSSIAKRNDWNTDYTTHGQKGGVWLANDNRAITVYGAAHQRNSSHIINPKGGFVGDSIKNIMGKNGLLDLQVT